MIGVCSIWDESFATGIAVKRWYNMTKQTAKAFGATHLLWVAGDMDTPIVSDQEIACEFYDTLFAVRQAHRTAELVFLDGAGETPLVGFQHPADVIYVVGTDNDGLDRLPTDEGETTIAIDADIALWAHVALGVVLSHRRL